MPAGLAAGGRRRQSTTGGLARSEGRTPTAVSALAVGEVENQRLRLDLQAQREANEARAVQMQRQIDRSVHHADEQDRKIAGLERAVSALRVQVRSLKGEPVA